MRLLSNDQQQQIILAVRNYLNTTGFLFAYDRWAEVISGIQEGAFLWAAVNYLYGELDKTVDSF